MNIDQSIKKEASGVLGRIALFLVYYIGLILFGIGLFVVAGWITLLALNISDPLSISIRLIIFGIVALLAMWWFCLELGLYLIRPILVSPDTTDSILPEIYEDDCPELFSMIREIAEVTGNKVPKHVYLSSEVNAFVSYDRVNFWSLFFPSGKNLTIGIGLLNGMNKSEIKAILGHEFGHFSQKTMKIGNITYRLMLNIRELVDFTQERQKDEAIAQASPDYKWYFHLANYPINYITKKTVSFYKYIERKNRSLSRLMEFEADNVACKIAGSEAHISALCKLDVLSQRYNLYEGVIQSLLSEGHSMSEWMEGYKYVYELLAEDESLHIDYSTIEKSPVGDDATVESRITLIDGWNTHPTLIERINNANSHGKEQVALDTTDACTLIPMQVLDSVGERREKEIVVNLGLTHGWGSVKPMSLSDFKEWASESFKTHRVPSFIYPFVNKTIVRFELPADEDLEKEEITNPFTEENRKMLLEFAQAYSDWETLTGIKQSDDKIHFTYNQKADIDITAALERHKTYLETFNSRLLALDVNIYKYLWKGCEDKRHLQVMYWMMFYSNEGLNAMGQLHQAVENLTSQLQFYNDYGASMRANPELLKRFASDFRSFMSSFDYENVSTFFGNLTNDKGISVNEQMKEWKEFASGDKMSGEIQYINEVWNLLQYMFKTLNGEWKRRVVCAYKGEKFCEPSAPDPTGSNESVKSSVSETKATETAAIEDGDNKDNKREPLDFDLMEKQSFIHLESAYRHQAIKFRRASEDNRISLGEIVGGMFTNVQKSDVQSMALVYRLAIYDNQEEKEIIFNDTDEIWNYDLFSCILKRKTDEGHYTMGLAHETTMIVKCVHKTVILVLTSLGGSDTIKYMRVTLLSPSYDKDDDGHSFMTSESTKTHNAPVILSFILSCSEVEENPEFGYYEQVEKTYNEKQNTHEKLDKVEEEYDHGMFEYRPQYYPGYGEWLFEQERYYDTFFTLERVFNFVRGSFDDVNKEWLSAYYMACNKMGICLSKMGREDEAIYYFRQGAPELTLQMPNYVALSTAKLGNPNAISLMNNWLMMVSQKYGKHDQWSEEVKQFSADVPVALANFKKKMDAALAADPTYDFRITIGYVLDRLMGIGQKNISRTMFVYDVENNKLLTRIADSDSISNYVLNTKEACDKVFVLSCSYAHYVTNEEFDKSILCTNAPIVISTHSATVAESAVVMRVDVVRCNFNNDDDKRGFDKLNLPLTRTFCLGESDSINYTQNKDSLLEAIRKAIDYRYEKRFVESLKLANWVFECTMNMVKNKTGLEFESQDELLKDILLESSYSVGYSLMELGNTAAASYYLELARYSMQYEHIQEYINFLSNTKDPQALEVVNDVLKHSPRPNNAEGEKRWKYHMAFLKRRLAYILIDKKKYADAENLLKEMLDDPLCKEFAEGELNYLEQQLKGN